MQQIRLTFTSVNFLNAYATLLSCCLCCCCCHHCRKFNLCFA